MASAYISKSKKGFQPKAPVRRNAIPGTVPVSSQASVRNSVDRQTQPTIREPTPQPPKVVASLSEVPSGAIAVLAPPAALNQTETANLEAAKNVANALIATDVDSSSSKTQSAATGQDQPVSILIPERHSTPYEQLVTNSTVTANSTTPQLDSTSASPNEPNARSDKPGHVVKEANETFNLEQTRPSEQLPLPSGEAQRQPDLKQNSVKEVRQRSGKKRVRSTNEERQPSKRARRSSDQGRQVSHETEERPLDNGQRKRSRQKGKTNNDLSAQPDDAGEGSSAPKSRKAGAKSKSTIQNWGEGTATTKKRERRKDNAHGQGARGRRKRERSPTPEGAENVVIEEDTLRMEELCKERRTGRKSVRAEEIKVFEAAEAERRAAAKARELAGEAPLESEEQTGTAEADEESGGRMLAPQTQIVNGEIVLIQDSTRIDRHAMADAEREAEAVVVIEENALNVRINSHYSLKKAPNRRWTDEDTEEFYQALRMFGTDFEIISKMFPTRSRRSVKLKYSHEEKVNLARISETLQADRIPVNIEEFSTWTKTEYADPAVLLAEMETDRKALEEEHAKEKEAIEEARRQRDAEAAAEAVATGEDASAKENEEQAGGAAKRAGRGGKRGQSKTQKGTQSKGRKGRKKPTFGGGEVEVLGRLEDNIHHQPKLPGP